MEQVLPEIREGERIAGDDELGVTLLADLEQIGVVEVRAKPSDGTPPLHLHEHHAECFFVLEGELTFRLEDRELRAGPETWVFVPPEVVHTFGVTNGSPAHFLNLHVPSSGLTHAGERLRRLPARTEPRLRPARPAGRRWNRPVVGGRRASF